MIGGLLLGIHWHSIFIFLAIYASISLFAAIKYLPETMPQPNRVSFSVSAVADRYKTIFSDKEFLLLVIALGANFSGFFLYVLSSPIFIVDHLGLTSTQFAYLFIPTVSGMIFGSYLSKKAAGKLSHKKTIQISYIWMGLIAFLNVLFCAFFETNLLINIGFVALYNIGMSLLCLFYLLQHLIVSKKLGGLRHQGKLLFRCYFLQFLRVW
jgi:DHA1 family bicyclomycin/chloramphenicol resistance-like MFS transporter